MATLDVIPIRDLPVVLTVCTPDYDRVLLGAVAAAATPGESWLESFYILSAKIAAEAQARYPSAELCCNFTMIQCDNHFVSGCCYRATADVYGGEIK